MRVILAVLIALVLATPASAAERYVSPSGSDSNPGTLTAPWRTVTHADNASASGDVVNLRAGAYGALGQSQTLDRASITWRTYPADPPRSARLLGKTYLRGSGARYSFLTFDGPTGNVGGNGCNGESVVVHAETIGTLTVDHSIIRDSQGHAGIYTTGGGNYVMTHNWIHNNGCLTDVNRDHGIYMGGGSGLIENNLIEDNVARGVQLYNGPANVRVNNNTIVNNGRAAVQIDASSNNTISNNIMAGNGYNGTHVALYHISGSGNVARDNLFWSNKNGNVAGMTCTNCPNANPLFVNAQFGYQLAGPFDFHLQATSPARGLAGIGAALTDFDDQTRDADPDSGYDEVVPTATPTPTPTPPPSC